MILVYGRQPNRLQRSVIELQSLHIQYVHVHVGVFKRSVQREGVDVTGKRHLFKRASAVHSKASSVRCDYGALIVE